MLWLGAANGGQNLRFGKKKEDIRERTILVVEDK